MAAGILGIILGNILECAAEVLFVPQFPISSYHRFMATIRISGAEAARDFAGLMDKVRAGAEVIIEDGTNPPAILRSAAPSPRTISESIEIARRLQRETGAAPVLDADFADDVAEIVRNRKPWTPPAWD